MQGSKPRRSTEKAFIEAAGQGRGGGGAHPVTYEYPGVFRTGALTVQVNESRIGYFAEKLSDVLSFHDYDRLTRTIWVAHWRAAGDRAELTSPAEGPP